MGNRTGGGLRVVIGEESALNSGNATPLGYSIPKASCSIGWTEEFAASDELRDDPNPAIPIRGLWTASGDLVQAVETEGVGRVAKYFLTKYTKTGTTTPSTHEFKVSTTTPTSIWMELGDTVEGRFDRFLGSGSSWRRTRRWSRKSSYFHDIRTPFFAVSYKGQLDHAHDIAFPLIIKPLAEDGSIGIDALSVLSSVKELMERIHYIHESFDCPALIEEYIEGREIYGAVLGNDKPEGLPLVEMDLSKLPEGTPKIAGTEVKWEKDSEAYRKTRSAVAEDLDEETTQHLQQTAVAAYQALQLRYGRKCQ